MPNTLTLLRSRLDHPLPKMYAMLFGAVVVVGLFGVLLDVFGVLPEVDGPPKPTPDYEPIWFSFIPDFVIFPIFLVMAVVIFVVVIWMHYAWITGRWEGDEHE